MVFDSITKLLVGVLVLFSPLFKAVDAGGPYANQCLNVPFAEAEYDFSTTSLETCPWPQHPHQVYATQNQNNLVLQMCNAYAALSTATTTLTAAQAKTAKLVGCVIYNEGFFLGRGFE